MTFKEKVKCPHCEKEITLILADHSGEFLEILVPPKQSTKFDLINETDNLYNNISDRVNRYENVSDNSGDDQ